MCVCVCVCVCVGEGSEGEWEDEEVEEVIGGDTGAGGSPMEQNTHDQVTALLHYHTCTLTNRK